MIRADATRDGRLVPVDDLGARNVWITLIAPTDAEIAQVEQATGIDADSLRAALDEEEQPRIEVGGPLCLVLLRCPVRRGDEPFARFETLPLGVLITPTHLVTVCLEPNEVLEQLRSQPIQPGVHTAKRTLFLLQVLYRTAVLYLRYLRQIDRRTDEIERALHRSMKNLELLRLLEMEKSLVYFTTSLRANLIVMDKLMRLHLRPGSNGGGGARANGSQGAGANGGFNGEGEGSGGAQTSAARPETAPAAAQPVLRLYEEDRDFLEDVITENRQAIEMAEVYSTILSGMMDAFASIISNNLNIVMKFLTSVTIVLSLPTMIASFYGMNVDLPFQHIPGAFGMVLVISLVLSGGAIWWLARRGMF